MSNFLFFLSRLVLFPIELVASPNSVLRTAWSGSARGRSLLLGLPAVLVACLGVALLCWAEFGVAKTMEQHYLAEVEKSNKEKKRLKKDMDQEIRMRQASTRITPEQVDQLITPDDPRKLGLETHQLRETIYLEKLISLNTSEPVYKYKLALALIEKEETRNRGLAIMNTISPVDEPGHVAGHLLLADYHLARPAQDPREKLMNVKIALAHSDMCLKRDKNNIAAMSMKARLLFAQRNFAQAYEIFERLFVTNPRYYEPLVEINGFLNRPEANPEILAEAIQRYSDVLEATETLTDSDRVKTWQELTKCYILKKDFETIEQQLLDEIQLQSNNPDNSGKRVWAEHLLARVYVGWLQQYPSTEVANLPSRLEFLEKAYGFNPTNPRVLRELVRLSANADQTIASQALQIYDATKRMDAPALVLNELGAQALGRSEYQSALEYFERARKKSPQVPEILNNLAYTYLVAERPNPKRALKLVDEAFRYLPNNSQNFEFRTYFHDTRGRAMMQLNRMSEAAAEFEFALRTRPDDQDILAALIKCYSANGLDPSPYENHLKSIREEQASER
ncbi:MAG: tetratricopeptide repeat protein [Mariniblastus sp.]|nr:tetratricopeptide repeat protein [Mariniblastus sp.]